MTTASLGSAVLAAFGVSASLVWLGFLVASLIERRRAVQLADVSADPPREGWPRLALIFAARNEAAGVEQAARSMLAQDYPALELVAVDDRSTDETGAILDAIAAGEPRLRVVHVGELPSGWLGKNHALHSAATASAADWVLFTDADVVFAPGVLRRAVAWAEANGADHLTVAPEVPTEGVGERLFLSMFGLLFLLYAPPWRVEDPSSGAHLGIGAFNLIRAEAFRAIGGYRRLALSVDDDMRLGQALKAAGFQTRVLLGFGAIRVRWHVGLAGMIRGVEKNFFAGLNFSLARVLVAVVGILWLGLTPHLALVVGPWWGTRLACAVGIVALGVLMKLTTWQGGISWVYALTLPISSLLCVVALLRSTWLTLRRKGVRWRDHHYPIEELRTHVQRRNAWVREVWKSTR